METTLKSEAAVYRAGTLVYTGRGLAVLFFWLLCNDLCLMLMEQVAPQLTPLLLKDHGAKNTDIALYLSTFSGILTLWINPFVSTWSDRHRGPLGRRRPFLLVACPVAALALCAIPFAPDLGKMLGLPPAVRVVELIGLVYLLYAAFNCVLMAIFAYYFWDVVPEAFLGRFSALTKMISSLASFLWNYYIFGLAANHMAYVYVSVGLFFLVVYMASILSVKEGQYPPPDDEESRQGLFGKVAAYCQECFGQSYYRWIFGAGIVFQIGNMSNMYQIFYYRDQLGISLDTIGKIRSWPALGVMLLAYPLGILIDRKKPIVLIPPILAAWSLINLSAFLFLRGPHSLTVFVYLIAIITFLFAVSYSVLNVEVFPRAKLGQFCSAAAVSSQLVGLALAYPLGLLLDTLKDYRYVFAWSALFEALAAVLFFKVYLNWKEKNAALSGAAQ